MANWAATRKLINYYLFKLVGRPACTPISLHHVSLSFSGYHTGDATTRHSSRGANLLMGRVDDRGKEMELVTVGVVFQIGKGIFLFTWPIYLIGYMQPTLSLSLNIISSV